MRGRVLSLLRRLRTSDDRTSVAVRAAAVVLGFTAVSVLLRGAFVANRNYLNPDEVESMAQALAARHSPVPYKTWATATTGPFWPLFLALLAILGLPMTAAFSHLLAAVFVGLIGAFGYVLARRALGPLVGLAVVVVVWLPLVLALPGNTWDFGGMVTELLPAVLLLGAASIPFASLDRRPWLHAIAGLLAGLAVGAKYQALPIALIVLAVPLVLGRVRRPRELATRAGLWVAGAAAPALVILVAMLLTPSVSWSIVGQFLTYLSQYGEKLSAGDRLRGTWYLLSADHVIVLLALVGWLALRSTRRVALARALAVAGGAAAVAAGGNMFGHYLFFMYAGLLIAIGLPLRPERPALPVVGEPRRTAAVATIALFAWLISFGPTLGGPQLTGPREFAAALDSDTVVRDPRLTAACPPGSQVLVWGWAPEMYVNYSWRNATPVFNTYLWSGTPANREAGYGIVRAAIENPATDCVFEASGDPYFYPPDERNPELAAFYPGLADILTRQYRTVPNLVDCAACTVHIRVVLP